MCLHTDLTIYGGRTTIITISISNSRRTISSISITTIIMASNLSCRPNWTSTNLTNPYGVRPITLTTSNPHLFGTTTTITTTTGTNLKTTPSSNMGNITKTTWWVSPRQKHSNSTTMVWTPSVRWTSLMLAAMVKETITWWTIISSNHRITFSSQRCRTYGQATTKVTKWGCNKITSLSHPSVLGPACLRSTIRSSTGPLLSLQLSSSPSIYILILHLNSKTHLSHQHPLLCLIQDLRLGQ